MQKSPKRARWTAAAAVAVLLGATVSISTNPTTAAAYGAGSCTIGTVGTAPSVPYVTAAPKTPEWSQQYAREQRVEVGLDSSSEAIAAAAADPDSTTDELGTPITPAEKAALDAQRSVAALAGTVKDTAATLGLSDVLNVLTDPADRSVIDVVLADSDCGIVARLAQLVPGTNLAAVQVPDAVSEAASIGLLDTLGHYTMKLWDQGTMIDEAEVDPISGRLEIHLDPTSKASADAVSNIVGTAGVDLFFDGKPSITTADRFNPPLSPLRAGEDITDGYERCTSNFDTQNAHPHSYLITAGHCFLSASDSVSMNGSDTNLWAYSAAKKLGTPDHSPVFNGAEISCDCEAIGPVAASSLTNNEVTGGPTGTVRNYTKVAYNSNDFENSPQVCLSGVSEADAYGQIVCGPITNAHVQESVCDPAGCSILHYVVDDEFKVDLGSHPAIGGDSGGPGATGGDTLMGVQSSTNGSTDYMSKARNIQTIYSGMDWFDLTHS